MCKLSNHTCARYEFWHNWWNATPRNVTVQEIVESLTRQRDPSDFFVVSAAPLLNECKFHAVAHMLSWYCTYSELFDDDVASKNLWTTNISWLQQQMFDLVRVLNPDDVESWLYSAPHRLKVGVLPVHAFYPKGRCISTVKDALSILSACSYGWSVTKKLSATMGQQHNTLQWCEVAFRTVSLHHLRCIHPYSVPLFEHWNATVTSRRQRVETELKKLIHNRDLVTFVILPYVGV